MAFTHEIYNESKKIKPMFHRELAKLVYNLEPDGVIEFGTYASNVEPPYEALYNTDEIDVSSWYFAKMIYIKEYDSRFVVIDYCGGGMAVAIPIEDQSDFGEFEEFASEFSRCLINNYSDFSGKYVFVEIDYKPERKTVEFVAERLHNVEIDWYPGMREYEIAKAVVDKIQKNNYPTIVDSPREICYTDIVRACVKE